LLKAALPATRQVSVLLEMKEKITYAEFASLAAPMRGLPVSHVWRGYGTAVFLEFGKLRSVPKGNNPKGEFCLDLQFGWRVERSRSSWFGSDSGDRKISNQLPKLIGTVAANISLQGRLAEVALYLEPQCWVTTFSAAAGQPEWTLFLPDGSWCHVVNGVMYHEDNDGAEQPGA
jgi:hypothetical protein